MKNLNSEFNVSFLRKHLVKNVLANYEVITIGPSFLSEAVQHRHSDVAGEKVEHALADGLINSRDRGPCGKERRQRRRRHVSAPPANTAIVNGPRA